MKTSQKGLEYQRKYNNKTLEEHNKKVCAKCGKSLLIYSWKTCERKICMNPPKKVKKKKVKVKTPYYGNKAWHDLGK